MFEFRTEWMYEYFNLISDSRVATSLLAVLLGVVLLSAHRHADAWIKWIGSSALLYGVVFIVVRVIQLTRGVDQVIVAPLIAVMAFGTASLFVAGLRAYFSEPGVTHGRFFWGLFGTGLTATAVLTWLTHGWPFSGPVVVSATCFVGSIWMVWTWRRKGYRMLLILAALFDLHPLLLAWTLANDVPLEQFRSNVVALCVAIFVMATSMLLQHQSQGLQRELALRKDAEDELRELAATLEIKVEARTRQLEDLVQGLKSFSGMVSHDLRGPLGNVVTVGELAKMSLAKGDVTKVASYLALLIKEGHRAVAMVTDLLMLARAEQAAVKKMPVDFHELTQDCVQSLSLSYPDAACKIEVSSLPVATADPGLMSHVLHNLLGNALKFGQGTQGLQVRVKSSLEGDCWRFEVHDNGPGFDSEQATKLFQPFERLDSKVAGTGLGLSVAKKIVECHGGQIGVRSQPGAGALFWWTLPVA